MDTNRLMEWLRNGYGVEDAAIYMGVPVADVRAEVARLRAGGVFLARLRALDQKPDYLRCVNGHRMTSDIVKINRRGARYCKRCEASNQKARNKRGWNNHKASQSMFGDGL